MMIGMRQIGPDDPPYVIAEIGVNHDGSVDRAMALTDAAADAGADAIKLQLFRADLLMSKAARLAAYQRSAGESDPIEMLRRLELSIDQMAPIVQRAHARGIHAIVTVFSVELADGAERLPWDAYKTASPDIVHRPLLDRLAATGKPMIVSTGASTMEEVARAVEWLAPARNRLVLLQCVSSYPTPIENAELGGIAALRSAFPGLPIGYSDHTEGEGTCIDAVNIGACVLEKHLTHSRRAAGPDHAASLESANLALYVLNARGTHAVRAVAAMGTAGLPGDLPKHLALALTPGPGVLPVKRVLDTERDVRAASRQSITALRPLPAGHVIARGDLTFKRPGTGIPPFELDRVLGRSLARPAEMDMPLEEAHLAPR